MTPKLNAEGFLARFDAMDERLVAKGFHRTPLWWRRELERFLRSGRRRWVIRAGRRAGKSSFLCRLAVAWALWGAWSVPAGDVAVIPFVSVDRDEAASRIRTVKDILAALGIGADVRTDEIELKDRACIFRVETCSTSSVGFTAIMVVFDEMARWESREDHSNPAKQVAASVRPAMATQPAAFEVCSSSPWGVDDYHCELFDQGETDHQCVSFAATWTANPTISEARSHELEPDEKIWSREYAAIPGATVSQALDREDVLACFGHSLCIPDAASPFCAIDSSKLRNDEFVCLFGYSSALSIQVDAIGAWNPSELRAVKLSDICQQIASHCHNRDIPLVFGDDFESMGITSEFERQQIRYVPYAWSDTSKDAAFQTLRRLMRDRRLQIVEHDSMRRELLACKAHLRPNGRTSYPTNGLDFLSALVSAMHAVNDGKILLVDAIDWDAYRERRSQRLTERLSQQPWSFRKSALVERLEARDKSASGVLNATPEQRAAATFPYSRLAPVTRRGRLLGGY